MKKISLFFACLIICALQSNSSAQSIGDINNAATKVSSGIKAGDLLTQLAGGLKSSSFTSAWNLKKTEWMNKASKVSDAAGMASSITSLTSYIKPESFKQSADAKTITTKAAASKTMTDATGTLSTLESSLKPEAYTSDWSSKKSSWSDALKLVK